MAKGKGFVDLSYSVSAEIMLNDRLMSLVSVPVSY